MQHIRDVLEPMGLEPKAIPTQYRGVKYRSRLEARWAVFLDHLGVEHEYEKEGYQLHSGWYLPDFWLPQLAAWLEIKPSEASKLEWRLAEELCIETRCRVYLANGLPADDGGVSVWFPFELEPDVCGFDEYYALCECPKCGRVGIEYEARGHRVCGARCFPDSDRGRGWTERLRSARLAAVQASFWDPQ